MKAIAFFYNSCQKFILLNKLIQIIRSIRLFLAALAMAAVACSPQSSKPGSGIAKPMSIEERPAILFLGDSITAGYQLDSQDAYPAIIQRNIDEAKLNYRVVNGGRSGDTTAGGLSRLSWYLQPENSVIAVVIALGANDSMRGFSLQEISKNLDAIIERIKAFDSKISIFLCQMHTFPNLGRQYADGYSHIFPKLARKHRITLLPFPLEKVYARSEFNQSDGIHPNKEGMKLVAETIWLSLKKEL